MILSDELIDDYIIGALPEAEREAFERQLAVDGDARARLEELRLLREMLRSCAPEVPSQRIWNAIQARLNAPELPSLWQRLSDALAGPRMRWSLAGAAAAMFLALGLQVVRTGISPVMPIAPLASKTEPLKAPHQAKLAKSNLKSVVVLAKGPAVNAKIEKHEPTEVEKALSDQDLDDVMATLIRQHQNVPALGGSTDPSVALGASETAPGNGGLSPVGYVTAAPEPQASPSAPLAMPDARNRVDTNGFWDFHPAAVAMNRHDWNTASSELQAAAGSAPEAAERSFARSTLQLLSQAGQPVATLDPTSSSGFSIQSAQRWQVLVENHLARYSGDVVARMPGLRSDGQDLSLDMAFDRASFGPGTHFVRVQDDQLSLVKNAQGEAINSTEFSAPKGADYLLSAHELRLK